MAKIKPKIYAKALADVILSGKKVEDKKIISNFVNLLVSVGLERKSKEILDLAESIVLQKQGKRKITFETARETTASQKKILEGFVNKGDIVKERISPELIAGVKIIINDSKQFDASMQSKLSRLWRDPDVAGQN